MFTVGTAVGFTLLKLIWMLKLLMEALAQFGLAIDMLIIFVLSVLSEVSSYKAKICVLGMLKSHSHLIGNNPV